MQDTGIFRPGKLLKEANGTLICSFAPKTLQYTILKRIGELFPGPAKVSCAHQFTTPRIAMVSAIVSLRQAFLTILKECCAPKSLTTFCSCKA